MRWVTKLEQGGAGTRITQELEYRVKFGRSAGSSTDS